MPVRLVWRTFVWLFLLPSLPAQRVAGQTYVCGTAKHATELTPASRFDGNQAGFDLLASPAVHNGSCSADRSFFFSAPLLEGNYRVTVDLGGPVPANTTVKAEARRLMLLNVRTSPHEHRQLSFSVNIRTTSLPGGGAVKVKPREIGSLRWDDKLTLEFAGTHPSVRSIRIAPESRIATVYLAGDSTVVDQDKEPWAAWGQMLPMFFNDQVAIANHAESGETIASSESERRFEKIFVTLHAGDYLFLQFGHNDQKPGAGYVPASTTYSELMRKYVRMTRERGATPVLVTSMNRRTFDARGHVTDTLAPYPQTVRAIAAETHTTLIDLNACSKTLYEAVGEAHSRELFVYAAANTWPGQTEPLHDDTHFNSYGAYELARCVIRDLRQSALPLRTFLRNIPPFDPAEPDAAKEGIPPSPLVETTTPYGR